MGRGLKSIPWKIGVMLRPVLPTCGIVCFFYPSLRARSRESVKRYKNLLADIFPQSQRSVKNEKDLKGVFDALLKSEPRFIRLRDEEGRTPRRQSSGAIARDNNGLLPIHLASIKGHIDVVRALLQYWPDSRELLNCHGQNILHVAAKSRGHNMGGHSLNSWDIFVLRRLTWAALKAAGAPLAYCRKAVNGKKKQASMQLEQVNIDSYKDRFNTLLLVSTLIATVTFAAGCTIPGGYNNIEPDQGMPTMLKHKLATLPLLGITLTKARRK
ncbi:unnamed protein product [Camellia sinensis]